MKGILFKPDMIKAIVEGRKTQTRRVIKPQPIDSVYELKEHSQVKGYYIPYAKDRRMVNNNAGDHKNDCGYLSRYRVGEVAYIKEAWRTDIIFDDLSPSELISEDMKAWNGVIYYDFDYHKPDGIFNSRKRSPMHLPAEFARYFIKITDVRAERLQEITLRDIEAEGIWTYEDPYKGKGSSISQCRMRFAKLWNTINKPPYDWNSNPWVWRYEFNLMK